MSRNGLSRAVTYSRRPASVGVHFGTDWVGGMVDVDGLFKDFLEKVVALGILVVTLFIPAIFGVIIPGVLKYPVYPGWNRRVDDLLHAIYENVGRQSFRRFAAHLGRNAFEAEARYVGTFG